MSSFTQQLQNIKDCINIQEENIKIEATKAIRKKKVKEQGVEVKTKIKNFQEFITGIEELVKGLNLDIGELNGVIQETKDFVKKTNSYMEDDRLEEDELKLTIFEVNDITIKMIEVLQKNEKLLPYAQSFTNKNKDEDGPLDLIKEISLEFNGEIEFDNENFTSKAMKQKWDVLQKNENKEKEEELTKKKIEFINKYLKETESEESFNEFVTNLKDFDKYKTFIEKVLKISKGFIIIYILHKIENPGSYKEGYEGLVNSTVGIELDKNSKGILEKIKTSIKEEEEEERKKREADAARRRKEAEEADAARRRKEAEEADAARKKREADEARRKKEEEEKSEEKDIDTTSIEPLIAQLQIYKEDISENLTEFIKWRNKIIKNTEGADAEYRKKINILLNLGNEENEINEKLDSAFSDKNLVNDIVGLRIIIEKLQQFKQYIQLLKKPCQHNDEKKRGSTEDVCIKQKERPNCVTNDNCRWKNEKKWNELDIDKWYKNEKGGRYNYFYRDNKNSNSFYSKISLTMNYHPKPTSSRLKLAQSATYILVEDTTKIGELDKLLNEAKKKHEQIKKEEEDKRLKEEKDSQELEDLRKEIKEKEEELKEKEEQISERDSEILKTKNIHEQEIKKLKAKQLEELQQEKEELTQKYKKKLINYKNINKNELEKKEAELKEKEKQRKEYEQKVKDTEKLMEEKKEELKTANDEEKEKINKEREELEKQSGALEEQKLLEEEKEKKLEEEKDNLEKKRLEILEEQSKIVEALKELKEERKKVEDREEEERRQKRKLAQEKFNENKGKLVEDAIGNLGEKDSMDNIKIKDLESYQKLHDKIKKFLVFKEDELIKAHHAKFYSDNINRNNEKLVETLGLIPGQPFLGIEGLPLIGGFGSEVKKEEEELILEDVKDKVRKFIKDNAEYIFDPSQHQQLSVKEYLKTL